MMIFGLDQPEPREDVSDVPLHRLGTDHQAGSDALIGLSFSHERENLSLPIGQFGQRTVIPLAGEQPGNNRGINDTFPLADTLHGIHEHVDV